MHCAAARRGGHTEVPTDMTSELCRLNQSFLEKPDSNSTRMVGRLGLEPRAHGLKARCSTD